MQGAGCRVQGLPSHESAIAAPDLILSPTASITCRPHATLLKTLYTTCTGLNLGFCYWERTVKRSCRLYNYLSWRSLGTGRTWTSPARVVCEVATGKGGVPGLGFKVEG